jgi:hypothetical protein
MSAIEIAFIVGGVLASFTVCAVKIIHQVQNSKCRLIDCCGAHCIRDVELDLPEVRTDPPPPLPANAKSTPANPPVPLPVPRPNIKEIRKVFEYGNHSLGWGQK